MKKRGISFLAVILILSIGLCGGFFLHDFLTSRQILFSSGLTREQLRAINEAQKIIQQYAVEKHDDEHSVDYALKGMAASLDDPYAYYYTAQEMKEYDQSSSGIVSGGIGATVTEHEGKIVLAEIFKGLYADAAGLKAGDVLLAVDGVSTGGMTLSDVVDHVKGEEKTTVVLNVMRDGRELAFTVTRGSGQRQMTEYKMLSGGILYIQIHAFHGNAAEYFKQAIEYGRVQNFSSVLIDLRDNLGGDATVFDEIADIMLPEGETFYALAQNGEKVYSCQSDDACVEKPVCVLINASSASASEALAGALRDLGNAVLVGVKSYGKGVMQTSYTLSNGGVFKLTTAYYYLPGGDCIEKKGLTPDYEVALPDELTDCSWLRNEENDLQLKKATELLTNSAN